MNQRWIWISAVILLVLIGFVVANRPKNSSPTEEKPHATKNSDITRFYNEALDLESSGKKLEAKAAFQKIMSDFPDYDQMEEIQEHLGDLNIAIVTSNIETPDTIFYEVQPGDSLGKISKQYTTTIDLIKKSNNMKNDVIRVGQRLRIWKSPFNIFVDKSQNILILKNGNEVVKVYHVSTGENNSSPVGIFKVVSRLVDPVWFKSGAVVPPESPDNVLGTRWMGFDIAGYGIHGTTEPDKIGQQVTAGCVRMRNQEVEELYDLIPLGTSVQIVD